MTPQVVIKPKEKRYQKRKEIVPNFLKKIEDQFM